MRITARVPVGAVIERLICHPRLPLIAGRAAARPAVHVWSCADGQLHEIAVISTGPDDTGPVFADPDDTDPIPSGPNHTDPDHELEFAWHPHERRLVVATGDGLVEWTPTAGAGPMAGVPPMAGPRIPAFSPDGTGCSPTTTGWRA